MSMLIYCLFCVVLLVIYLFAAQRKLKQNRSITYELNTISVVVPFRNEAENLPALIQSFQEQTRLPKELIFVNDHSEDRSSELVNTISIQQLPVKLIHLDKLHQGKKNALLKGIELAQGDFILTLDADISLPKTYFESLEHLQQAELSILPVSMQGVNFIGYFAALEYHFLNAINVAVATLFKPILASGANLLVKKSVFEAYTVSSNSSQYSSGDDIFLLNFCKQNALKIQLTQSSELVVKTKAPSDFHSFFQQRIRWIGKSKHVKDKLANRVGLIGILYQLGFVYFTLLGSFHLEFILFKLGLDCCILIVYLKKIKETVNLAFIPIFSLLYPLYGFLLILYRMIYSPKWKGRVVVE